MQLNPFILNKVHYAVILFSYVNIVFCLKESNENKAGSDQW